MIRAAAPGAVNGFAAAGGVAVIAWGAVAGRLRAHRAGGRGHGPFQRTTPSSATS
jgi:hypothetical protein